MIKVSVDFVAGNFIQYYHDRDNNEKRKNVTACAFLSSIKEEPLSITGQTLTTQEVAFLWRLKSLLIEFHTNVSVADATSASGVDQHPAVRCVGTPVAEWLVSKASEQGPGARNAAD